MRCMRMAWAGSAVLGVVVAGAGCQRMTHAGDFGAAQFLAGRLSEFPMGAPTIIQKRGVFVFHDGRGFQVMSAVCTHSEAVMYWNQPAEQVKCIHHGCIYDRQGRVRQGPAMTPLPFYYCFVEKDLLWVDRSRRVGPTFFASTRGRRRAAPGAGGRIELGADGREPPPRGRSGDGH